eukprot:m.299048 g.299048  ORF g.299048 m.299048 type:complete len:119 (+) comp15867_c0_seq2:686-1042(+)
MMFAAEASATMADSTRSVRLIMFPFNAAQYTRQVIDKKTENQECSLFDAVPFKRRKCRQTTTLVSSVAPQHTSSPTQQQLSLYVHGTVTQVQACNSFDRCVHCVCVCVRHHCTCNISV